MTEHAATHENNIRDKHGGEDEHASSSSFNEHNGETGNTEMKMNFPPLPGSSSSSSSSDSWNPSPSPLCSPLSVQFHVLCSPSLPSSVHVNSTGKHRSSSSSLPSSVPDRGPPFSSSPPSSVSNSSPTLLQSLPFSFPPTPRLSSHGSFLSWTVLSFFLPVQFCSLSCVDSWPVPSNLASSAWLSPPSCVLLQPLL